MFFNLAWRNSKRSRNENLIYFLTMVTAVAAFYIVLSLGAQDVIRFLSSLESDAVERLLTNLLPTVYVCALLFGILMSNVHMAWTRAVCGRLKSDYSYSNMIVYNNFPWPSPTNDQKEKIRKTAQAILNARALYTDSNLADLYDPLTMPTELLKAHKANNRAVMHAYGFSIKMSEADCVAELMRMYQKLTKEK